MLEKKNLTYWLVVCSFILILMDYFGKLALIKTPSDQIIIPIKKSIFSTGVFARSFFSSISSFPKLDQMTKDLLELQQDKEELNLQVALLTEENEKLRVQLEAPLSPSFKYIPARVMSLSRFLEIDAGENEGVTVDMLVVDGTTFVGKIKTVNPSRSLVILPWDLESAVPVKTLRETRGVAVGQSQGTIVFDKILQKDPLFLNDKVVTSGEAGIPPNLLFGKVAHIISDETSAYKQAKIEPAVNYQDERYVFIISSQN